MPNENAKESLYNKNLPLNLAATVRHLKDEYIQADDVGKEACLNELKEWMMHEKMMREYGKSLEPK
jgi:hypothetical protein